MLGEITSLPLRVLVTLIPLWSRLIQLDGLTVKPPEEVVIHDPGHLGQLLISWSSPGNLHNLTDCFVRFQLEYFNTYKHRWTAIRTVRRSYSAQFDLEKEVKVRVYTLLAGACTNYSEIQSNFTELALLPSSTEDVNGHRVQGFLCVFHQLEYMECSWVRSPEQPALYFWYREMEHAEECQNYIVHNGDRTGCNFSRESLEEFTDFNICVNGSSTARALRPAFFTLQLQNQVKPAAAEVLSLEAGPDRQLEMRWGSPHGKVPEHCLEWEVEIREEMVDRPPLLRKSLTTETTFTYVYTEDAERKCFRVRSRVNQYCADRSFWSDWSHWSCHPDMKMVDPGTGLDVVVCIAVVGITSLTLLLCLLALWTMCNSRKEKKDELFLSSAESTTA